MSSTVPVTDSSDAKECPDFLTTGVLWNAQRFPWFLVSVRVRDEGRLLDEVLMVPTHLHMKDVVRLVSETFHIVAVDYVSPGHVNGSGKWMIEPVMELSELSSLEGLLVPRCKVAADRVYRGHRLEHSGELGNERTIYRSH